VPEGGTGNRVRRSRSFSNTVGGRREPEGSLRVLHDRLRKSKKTSARLRGRDELGKNQIGRASKHEGNGDQGEGECISRMNRVVGGGASGGRRVQKA